MSKLSDRLDTRFSKSEIKVTDEKKDPKLRSGVSDLPFPKDDEYFWIVNGSSDNPCIICKGKARQICGKKKSSGIHSMCLQCFWSLKEKGYNICMDLAEKKGNMLTILDDEDSLADVVFKD